jgi:hypothetical protein
VALSAGYPPVGSPHPGGALWQGLRARPQPEDTAALATQGGFNSRQEPEASASPTKLGPSGVYGWHRTISCFLREKD